MAPLGLWHRTYRGYAGHGGKEFTPPDVAAEVGLWGSAHVKGQGLVQVNELVQVDGNEGEALEGGLF